MLRKTCKILNNIILVILVLLVLIMFVPRLIGWQNLAVLSGSMEPNISVGSMIIVKNVNPEELEAGDIITFRVSDSTLVTHRVVENNVETQEITTKGDANDVNDGNPVSYSNVIGELFISIPLLGYLSIYMQSTLGIAILCGVVFVLLLLNYLPDLFEKEQNNTEKKL